MVENLDDPLFVIDEAPPLWVSVAALQCRMRELFATMPLHRAVAESVLHIGSLLEAEYAVMHARFGAQLLSEEWARPEFALSDSLREQVNAAMMEATQADAARCVRLGGEAGERAVVAAILYGDSAEQAGCAGFVFSDCTRAHAYELLVQIEALVGFLALLLTERARGAVAGAVGPAALSNANEPLRLLLQLVAEVSSRHALDQVAVGVVDGHDVRVALVNNETDIRQANPGVRVIRDAMAECLDHGAPIIRSAEPTDSEFRLHGAWLGRRGSGAVASLPLKIDERIVAIVAMASRDPAALRPELLGVILREMSSYAALLPVARLATRSLWRHARDALAALVVTICGHRRRFLLSSASILLAAGWLAFGTLPYSITVPAIVRAVDRRIVSCPRDGILADLYVRPGDQVRAGQMLAELDSHDDTLAKAELDAQLMALDAKIDQALGEHDSGALRVLEAQRGGIVSQAAIVARRIEQARIRAPQDAVVLAGELREKLGARLAMGDGMFELARYDGAQVEVRIPEHQVLEARQLQRIVFRAAAAPETEHVLAQLRMAPATRVVDGKNVFVAEATAAATMAGLPPGMEGFAVIDVGARPAWWMLCHRALDWMRLNFWV